MNIACEMKQLVGGRYKLNAVKPDGSVRELTGWFDNLITNVGLDQIAIHGDAPFSIASLFTICKVGTGSATPAFTDTALAAPLAASVTNNAVTLSFVEGTPAYWSAIRTFRFGVGAATGNLTEVAVLDAGTSQAFSRALITDGGGTPITVSVLSDEILDVTYEYRSYIDKTIYTDSILISGVGYSMARMPYDIGSCPNIDRAIRVDGAGGFGATAYNSNVLGTVYQTIPAGGAAPGSDSATLAPYTVGNYYRDITFLYNAATAVYGDGIGALVMDLRQTKMKCGFTPKIPKTNVKSLSMTFRISWARYP